jgi:small subunit ribosomal protein S1
VAASQFAESQIRFFNKLQEGQRLQGKVIRITYYGAFVRIGLINGLVATKDITWSRIKDPADFLKLWQEVEVVVLSIDKKKQRVLLGIKQLLAHPWEKYKDAYKEGDTVVGRVVSIQDYGAFLQIKPGFEGLVHLSQAETGKQAKSAKEIFKMDEEYEATIIHFDPVNRKLGLSLKED